jgi:hypothetical protein
MAHAAKPVEIIETDDKAFIFTCPMPENAFAELDEETTHLIDHGEKGFEVRLVGEGISLLDALNTIQYIWQELYDVGSVHTTAVPDIIFDGDESRSTYVRY